MKKIVIIFSLILLLGVVSLIYGSFKKSKTSQNTSGVQNFQNKTEAESLKEYTQNQASETEIIAQNLDIPWEVIYLPDDEGILMTQRTGTLLKLGQDDFSI